MKTMPRPMIVDAERQSRRIGTHASLEEERGRERGREGGRGNFFQLSTTIVCHKRVLAWLPYIEHSSHPVFEVLVDDEEEGQFVYTISHHATLQEKHHHCRYSTERGERRLIDKEREYILK